MKRTLFVFFLLALSGPRLQADNPCVWGEWTPYIYPQLQASIITVTPTNLLSCGSASLQLSAWVTPGTRRAYDNCGNVTNASWPGTASLTWSYVYITDDGVVQPSRACTNLLPSLLPGAYAVTATVTGTATNPPWTATILRTSTLQVACSSNACGSRYWRLDNTNTWLGEQGQLPLLATNVLGVASWSTNAVLIDSTNPAALVYRDTETNGDLNITCRQGAVRFWFRPDWSSADAGGAGPGSLGRFLEVGCQTPTNGWWSLTVSPDGTQVLFCTQTNGVAETNASAAISWASNEWHQVVLAYTHTSSQIYLDGQLAALGTAVRYYPNAAERAASGLKLGSDGATNQARGTFDELETFACPLDADSILANYNEASLGFKSNSLPAPYGLVAWWQAEGNTLDATGLNPPGTIQGAVSYTSGRVGQAFNFGGNADVHVTASASLDMGGNGKGLTVEGWIRPTITNNYYSIVESDAGGPGNGVLGFLGSVNNNGDLYGYLVDVQGGWHEVTSPGGLIVSNMFYHVAMTYDPSNGVAHLYCNGVQVDDSGSRIGSFAVPACHDLFLGYSAYWGIDYQGQIDELSVYDRPLTAAEVAAIYQNGGLGKQPLVPTILVPPTNQVVLVGGSATFSVVASGTSPLAYQWRWNGMNIPGATSSSYALAGIQAAQAGRYSVMVNNAAGAVYSLDAFLTVTTSPVTVTIDNPENGTLIP